MGEKGVLIVGVGGLGTPAAYALARGGIARLGLVDPDPVELSNLARQVLYDMRDIGRSKVDAAARRLREIAPGLEVERFPVELAAENARSIVARFGFVIDGTDNPVAKFLVNDICVALRRPFVYAGVLGFAGQAMTVVPGRTACLKCLFEEPPDAQNVPSCRVAGIVGPVAGAIGEVQAAEALRWMRGEVPALAGRILTYEANGPGRVRVLEVAPRRGCGCGAFRAEGDASARPSTREK